MSLGTTPKERDLVIELASKLSPQFKNIWTHKKVSASQKFREFVKGKLGYLPILQPEFDLVFELHNGDMNAVEVKYLNSTSKGYNLPYYLGIGQTLALQRFGFDHVGLWLVVGEKVSSPDLNRYGAEAWTFIRNELQLSMEYSYFRNIKYDFDSRFLVMQYTGKQTGHELLDVDDRNFQITWKHPNPFKYDATAKVLREAVTLYLKDAL